MLNIALDLENLKKKRRMRILGARIFLSLLAGKFDIFKQSITSWND